MQVLIPFIAGHRSLPALAALSDEELIRLNPLHSGASVASARELARLAFTPGVLIPFIAGHRSLHKEYIRAQLRPDGS